MGSKPLQYRSRTDDRAAATAGLDPGRNWWLTVIACCLALVGTLVVVPLGWRIYDEERPQALQPMPLGEATRELSRVLQGVTVPFHCEAAARQRAIAGQLCWYHFTVDPTATKGLVQWLMEQWTRQPQCSATRWDDWDQATREGWSWHLDAKNVPAWWRPGSLDEVVVVALRDHGTEAEGLAGGVVPYYVAVSGAGDVFLFELKGWRGRDSIAGTENGTIRISHE